MNDARTLPQPLTRDGLAHPPRHGLRAVLGTAAWQRLPEAVRERFADHAANVTYAGCLEIVRASWLGRSEGSRESASAAAAETSGAANEVPLASRYSASVAQKE